jgi:Kef-type K+ transport system membrane component KefB
MELVPKILITLGIFFLVGLLTDLLGRRTPLPRVTLLLLAGFFMGPWGLDVLPDFGKEWFPVVTDIALSMVGFLVGHNMSFRSLQKRGKPVLGISIGEVLGAAVAMFVGLVLMGFRPEIALLLAGIAPASDPVATLDVIHEVKGKGEFSQTLQSVVAIDDAWGLIMFSFLLAVVQSLYGNGDGWDILLIGAWEIGGAVLLGLLLGIPMSYFTGRLQPGEPTLTEALGIVLLCGGLAIWLHVSFILAGMVLGATVANLATHHRRPFTAIEGIEWPFMILFFILAGASLEIDSLWETSLLGIAYILLRMVGLVLGAWAGGVMSEADPAWRRWMGLALWPQAGVALGMALLASYHLPEFKAVIMPVVIGSTIIFELIGPVMTRKALIKAGEGQTSNEVGN